MVSARGGMADLLAQAGQRDRLADGAGRGRGHPPLPPLWRRSPSPFPLGFKGDAILESSFAQLWAARGPALPRTLPTGNPR